MYPPNSTPLSSMPPVQEAPAGVVWPLPPMVSDENQGPVASFPFKEEYRKVKGNVSDFRIGTVTLSSLGVDLQGKMAPCAEVRTPIVILFFILLRGIGGLIAHYVIDYGFRRDGALRIGWDNVQSIVVSPKHQRACLAFNAPNQKGKVKLFSLAFRLLPAEFAQFLETVQHYAADRVVEGRIPGATPVVIWILLIVLVALLIAGVFGGLISNPGRGH